jgi:NAD(P) transhydrogenase
VPDDLFGNAYEYLIRNFASKAGKSSGEFYTPKEVAYLMSEIVGPRPGHLVCDWAAGDVIGFPSLASTSMEQGRLAACHAFGQPATSTPEHFPYGIYGIPEMSMVGQTERELTEKKVPYEIGVARLRETARGQIMGIQEGLLKILVSQDNRRVLGVHIIGEGASELIHIGQATLALGATLNYYLEAVFNHPTLAEAYKIAALDAWDRICA